MKKKKKRKKNLAKVRNKEKNERNDLEKNVKFSKNKQQKRN